MQGISWSLYVFVIIALCLQAFGAPNSLRVKRDDELQFNDPSSDLNPIEAEESQNDGLDREKRKLPDAVFDSKNAVLGFVFGTSKSSGQASAQASRPRPRTTRAPITTTTDDTPDFDRSMVSLDIPDRLFSNSFTTVTKVSKIVGDLMMSTARRYSQFVQFFKPILGKTLTVKGYRPPITTTSKPGSDNDV